MHIIDYIIVSLSILAAIGTGVYFAHKQKDTSQYFAGGGKIPAWAVGISIFATLISSVTFLAYPGAAYADNWILLVQGLMVPIVLLALIGVIVPLFRKVIRLSTYEYFERRFGLFARLYSSFAFTLGHFSKAGTVFFLVSMALATFLDINIYSIVLILGVTIIILTLFGGMEAIVWMDVAQGFLLIGGGIICILILMLALRVVLQRPSASPRNTTRFPLARTTGVCLNCASSSWCSMVSSMPCRNMEPTRPLYSAILLRKMTRRPRKQLTSVY